MSNIQIITAPTGGAPTSLDDYVAQNNLLDALVLMNGGPLRVDLANTKIPKGAIIQCGGAVFKATADEVITGTASYYVKMTPSAGGMELSPSFVTDLTGVSWNDAYNGYYDSSENLYLFDEGLAFLLGEVTALREIPRSAVPFSPDTQEEGIFYGGTTNPAHSKRLNYDGELHAYGIAAHELSASQAVLTDANKKLVSQGTTGSGNVVRSVSPTITGTLSVATANFSGLLAANGGIKLPSASPSVPNTGWSGLPITWPPADPPPAYIMGNPSAWIPVTIGGSTYYVPAYKF